MRSIDAETVRPGADFFDRGGLDPSDLQHVIASWQTELARSVGASRMWIDSAASPYATEKPGWKGLGGLKLLAAYAVRPDLDPNKTKKRFGRKPTWDNARNYYESAAFEAGRLDPGVYPSILADTSWWLPVEGAPTVFESARPDGGVEIMSRVDQLLRELRQLAAIYNVRGEMARQLRAQGPGPGDNPYQNGIFGIAAFLPLAEYSLQTDQPLLVDF